MTDQPTDTKNATKTKSPRWMKILLTISLALNLLIIGAAAAKVFIPHLHSFGKGHHYSQYNPLARPAAMHHAGRHLMWKLSRERRREMLKLVHTHRNNMQNEFANLAKTRLAFARLVAIQPDNHEAFEKTYAAIKDAEAALHQKASALTKDFIQKLTPQERKTYLQILQNPQKRRWFKKRSEF